MFFCRCSLSRPPKVPTTRPELERTTDIWLETMSDVCFQLSEDCLVEDNKFVGTTAEFNEDWEIIPLRPDLRPKEYLNWFPTERANEYSVNPHFEDRKDRLIHAAKSTCFIAVKPGMDNQRRDITYSYGTAFFVSPKILLTVAHIVADGHRKIIAQLPGTRPRTPFVRKLCAKPSFDVLECRWIASGYPNLDISVLEVTGKFRAEHYLTIEPQPTGFGPGCVDVIGYPDHLMNDYI